MPATCALCDDLRYRTRAGARWAEAVVCSCQDACKECGGTGRQRFDRPDGRVEFGTCSCRHLAARVQHFNRAHLPATYHSKRVERFDLADATAAEARKAVLEFQARGKLGDRGLMLIGPPGVGKTHLLCGLLRFLVLERGMTARYVDSFQLLEELRQHFELGKGASKLMEEVASVPVLGLDELGKTRATGWQIEVLDQIVSRRYDGGLTTFVVTNYRIRPGEGGDPEPQLGGRRRAEVVAPKAAEESLQDRVGQRIFSRLVAMCRPMEIVAPDRRLKDG